MFTKKTILSALALCTAFSLFAQTDPKETEQWSPAPPIVTPGMSAFTNPPSDAIILFDGKNLDAWKNANNPSQPADWLVSKGILTVNKKAGNIQTKETFTDYQLHIEWRVPADIEGEGQARGNSGLFLASTGPGDAGYELQILDNYNNTTYVNGQAGSIYKQFPPLVNACRKPGEWQSYDIVWTAPRFNEDGSLASPARITVFQNGVLIQNNTVLKGQTLYIGKPFYKAHGPAPIKLQAHWDKSKPISFKNIWIRKLS